MPVAEPLLRPILAFMALVVCCGTLIATTAALTRPRIEENRAARFRQTLTELTGSARLAATVRWSDDDIAPLCDGRALLRGVAPGYGGDIRWLASADVSGREPVLGSVRVPAHQETPGIADFLDRPTQGWVASLRGDAAEELRGVNGVTGATITSHALARSLASGLARPGLETIECPR